MASGDESPAKNIPIKDVNFTQRDFQLLAAAMSSGKTDFAVDYEKFAIAGGFKNSNSAKASWHGLKKKLDKVSATDAANGTETQTPNSMGDKRKKPDDDEDDAVSKTHGGGTSTKRPRKAPTKSKKGAATNPNGEDDAAEDVNAPSPSKKTKKNPGKGKKASQAADASGEHVTAEPSLSPANGKKKGADKVEVAAKAEIKVDDDKDETEEEKTTEKNENADEDFEKADGATEHAKEE